MQVVLPCASSLSALLADSAIVWTVRHPLRRRQAHWLHRTRLRQRRWCILIPGEDLHCLPAEFRPDYFFKHIAPPFCTFPLLCSPLASTSRHCTWRPCFTAVTSPCSFFSPDRQRQAPKLRPCRQRHRVVSFRAHAGLLDCLLACLWPGWRTVVEVVNICTQILLGVIMIVFSQMHSVVEMSQEVTCLNRCIGAKSDQKSSQQVDQPAG